VLGLLLLAFGGGGQATPQAHLLVVDLDDSVVSGFLKSSFGQGPMAEMVVMEQVAEEEGRRLIRKGDGSALLVIPEGFGNAVLVSEPMALQLITNPAQIILPGIIEEMLSILTDLAFYLQQLVGDELKIIAEQPTGDISSFFSGTSGVIESAGNKVVDRIGTKLNPPLLTLETTVVETDSGQDLDIGPLFFQGMFFLALFFMAQGLSDDIWVEQERGTLRRALTTPHAISKVLAGKMLAGAVLFGMVSLLVLSAGIALYGFGFDNLVPAVLWSALTGVLLLALLTLLQMCAGSHRTGSIVANLVMFPLIMIGGNFFPFEMMPDWLAAIGRLTPNGWALEQLKMILAGTATSGGLAVAFSGMAAVGLVAVALSVRRLRGGFAQS
jgi:ABC-type multidrug transport system permease subunit